MRVKGFFCFEPTITYIVPLFLRIIRWVLEAWL